VSTADCLAEQLLRRAQEMRDHQQREGANQNQRVAAAGAGGAEQRPPRFACRSAEVVQAEQSAQQRLSRLGLSPGDVMAAGILAGSPPPQGTILGASRSARRHNALVAAEHRRASASRLPADADALLTSLREQTREEAYERINAATLQAEAARRAAFPPSVHSERMFHRLADTSAVPEGAAHRKKRVIESFGRGVPLRAARPDACSICLEALAKGETCLTLSCGHLFHEHCIHEWLGRKEWCPLCKAPVI
jgi:hypothetical protein